MQLQDMQILKFSVLSSSLSFFQFIILALISATIPKLIAPVDVSPALAK